MMILCVTSNHGVPRAGSLSLGRGVSYVSELEERY